MSERPDRLVVKLIEKLGDIDPIVRRNAAGALGMQGARAVIAMPALSALLADNDPRVRREVEKVLDQLRAVATPAVSLSSATVARVLQRYA